MRKISYVFELLIDLFLCKKAITERFSFHEVCGLVVGPYKNTF